MLTDAQKAKVTAANVGFYSDPEFAGLSDLTVNLTITPPTPQVETDSVDVKPELPAVDNAAPEGA